jgi:hypothetical protein
MQPEKRLNQFFYQIIKNTLRRTTGINCSSSPNVCSNSDSSDQNISVSSPLIDEMFDVISVVENSGNQSLPVL